MTYLLWIQWTSEVGPPPLYRSWQYTTTFEAPFEYYLIAFKWYFHFPCQSKKRTPQNPKRIQSRRYLRVYFQAGEQRIHLTWPHAIVVIKQKQFLLIQHSRVVVAIEQLLGLEDVAEKQLTRHMHFDGTFFSFF